MLSRILRAQIFLLALTVGIASFAGAQTEDEVLWQKLDITQDGWLDGKELDEALKEYDTNGDKEVTKAEFLAGRAKARSVSNPAAATGDNTKPVTKPAPKPADKPAAQPAPATKAKEAMPAPAVMTKDKINGLFFMTRFWSGSNSLETATWYFAPDGKYYRDLTTGFSSAELAAFDGEKGTYKVAGNVLSTTRSDGEKTESEIEPSTNSWYWSGGLFTAVTPFATATELVGSYEGGESSVYSGNVATISKTLQLQPNGTFSWGGRASFKTDGDTTNASESSLVGKWNLSGYVLTLTTNDGQVTKGISFPYDDKKTEIKPDRFYFAGTMYKKQ